MKRKKFLITYDITSDKKRKLISDLLEKEGIRLQYSVFECIMNTGKLNQIIKKIERTINTKTDSVLIYFLCELCEGKKIMLGKQYFLKIRNIFIN
ncbi:MAG: CRISPR-associated endonuclease Cas2 [Bacteroidetes bacterium]|nr:CRISPR-associated endonuclease Cas2 [Bacteroidota bacterium]